LPNALRKSPYLEIFQHGKELIFAQALGPLLQTTVRWLIPEQFGLVLEHSKSALPWSVPNQLHKWAIDLFQIANETPEERIPANQVNRLEPYYHRAQFPKLEQTNSHGIVPLPDEGCHLDHGQGNP
jgi:hypothetical protein